MSSKGKGRKRTVNDIEDEVSQVDLFARLTTKDADADNDEADDSDTTDSDGSEYSDLIEEGDSDAESFEELGDSDEDDEEDERDADEDDDESSSEEEEDSNTESAEEEKKNYLKNKKNDAKSTTKAKEKNTKDTTIEGTTPAKPVTEITKNTRKSKSMKKTIGTVPHGDYSGTTDTVGSSRPATSSAPLGEMPVKDEYEFDSSDEEDLRNTVGNIPMEWYREYEHIGYNLDGEKIIKPAAGDQLDEFLNKMDNPDYWRTIVDKSTGQNVLLSEKDCQLIQNFRRGKYTDPKMDPYKPWVDFFTHEKMLHPVTNRPEDKRSFVPSKWERLKVGRMVHALKMGWMKPLKETREAKEEKPEYYMLWKDDEQPNITKQYLSKIPAPKLPLPGHEESYNPPPEYILTEEEELAWKQQDPEDRRVKFLPKKFSSLRQVPGYDRFINERWARCLDLYLCPRQRKTRMHVNPEDLLPKLPKPKDLQPFPTTQSLVYKGHTNMVRCISVESGGQWFVSGSDDETIKLWELSTGRCMKTLHMGGVVKGVAWNPNPSLCLIAVIVENDVIIVNPGLADKLILSNTDNLINSYIESETENKDSDQWHLYSGEDYDKGFRIKVNHFKVVSNVTWHARGDYMAVVIAGGQSKSVVIHQLSKRRSQYPFSKPKGLVQCVLFHPTRPFLFVATQRYVRIYNLLKQELSKKLMTNVKWVSSMAVHPAGDNVIVGSYDSKLTWFDLDLSTKPYQTLRHHKRAIRQVCYHKTYPLFASSSDDGSIIICHGRVYNDLLQNPLIVPVKVLRGHAVQNSLGVLGCEFHPTQPWVLSCGSDGTIRLFT